MFLNLGSLSKLKSFRLLAWGLFICFGLTLLYGAGSRDAFRIPIAETTRRKFHLYRGVEIALFQAKSLEQTFVSNYPGLSQIDILFLGGDQTQTLHFHLKQKCDAVAEMVEISVELPSHPGPIFQAFTFSPIDSSAGQTYCFILEAPEASADNPVKLPLSHGDLYPYGNVAVHDPELDQVNQQFASEKSMDSQNNDLPYRLFLPIVVSQGGGELLSVEDAGFLLNYRGLLWPTIQTFFARVTANKPYFWGQPWFYVGLGLAYIILLGGLFLLVRRMIQLDQPE